MILKGDKVILRTIRLDDAPRFVKWFNDGTVTKFLALRQMNLKDEVKYIKDRLKIKPKNILHLCIDTKDGVHIGATDLRNINKATKSAEFGIMIGHKNFWDKGYGTDATKTLLNYGFNKLKLHRISLSVYSYNNRAIKVYKKLGFKKEGVLREATYWNKKFWDIHQMGILDREWKKLNKK